MPTVYLSGSITGLTYDEATDWRDKSEVVFALNNINAVSPLRAKAFLKEQDKLSAALDNGHGVASNQGVTNRDRFDTMNCDCLLVNLLGATRVSIGTMVELGWADAAKIPIVIAMESDNIHQHCFVNTLATYIVDSIEEAQQMVVEMLKPYVANPKANLVRGCP